MIAIGKKRIWFGALLSGAVMIGLLYGLHLIRSKHHYRELETFFRGSVGETPVLGISFLDYDGWGFLETNQWKVVIEDEAGRRTTIYQKRPVFQESIPYQPKVTISDRKITINDGESKLDIEVTPGPPLTRQK
jgi:hypothetical protein